MSDEPTTPDAFRASAERFAHKLLGLPEADRLRELRELKLHRPQFHSVVTSLMHLAKATVSPPRTAVVLVGLDGVHIGEFEIAGEVLPKAVRMPSGRNWGYRLFVQRTNNYYDEVEPVPVIVPKPPKV